MRRLYPLGLVLVVACTTGGDPITTTTASSPPATTAPVSPTSSTIATAPTTSTTAPGTTTSTISLDETVLAYQEVVSGLPFPIQLTARPGSSSSYLITKDGVVWWLEDGEIGQVLDIRDQVRDQGEQGLLGIALHPEDEQLFYLHYSDDSGDTVVSEWRLVGARSADPGSERVLLQVDQPASNHNGGTIQFLPDGRLLLGLGDGGGAGDQFGNAQNPDTLLGGLVAVDVATGAAELYAMGLRNPWRFWIDGELIYVADVGQDAYEEVSVAPLQPGHNFGWPITEGRQCYRPSSGCDTTGQLLPVLEVANGDGGTCAITGGPVYRGLSLPQLDGVYFYSDYCGGYLRSFRYRDGAATDLRDWSAQVGIPGSVPGFGVDGQGEMYVLTTEQVLRVEAGG